MKRILLVLLALVFISPMISMGAEKDSISVKLVWEKEFPEPVPGKVYGGIYDVAFDKNRGGLFCPSVVVTGNPENAREIIYFDSTGKVVKTRKLKEWTQVRISSNGKYIAIMHPEKWDKEFHYGPVDIETISGKFVKRIDGVYGSWWWLSPKGNEIIEKDVWADEDIYYFRGTPGKSTANLTKKKGDFILFDGKPAIKWTGTENQYLQIGNNMVALPGILHWSLIATSSNGKYVAIPSLLLYTKGGNLLGKFDLEKNGMVLPSFSPNGKFLAVAVKNFVYLIDVEKMKILWRYESDDPHQLLNLCTCLDFPLESPFYVAGVFWHYEKAGFKNSSEKIIILSKEGKVLLEFPLGKGLNRSGSCEFKVNKTGNMLCYVTPHRIRVFKIRGMK